ncbi:MAG: hypothetical protein U0R50_03025 [Gaiellales bacterium]
MTTFCVYTCKRCGTAHFPRPELCAGCAARALDPTPAPVGRVVHVTHHRGAAVAEVALTTSSVTILARAVDAVVGDDVRLTLDGGAPVASPS